MTARPEELNEFLTRLKHRRGRSYEWIGARVNVSKSAVQRYCVGTSVPREFGVVEDIARVCGADRAEMARLFQLWLRATTKTSADGLSSAPAAAVELAGETGPERSGSELSGSGPQLSAVRPIGEDRGSGTGRPSPLVEAAVAVAPPDRSSGDDPAARAAPDGPPGRGQPARRRIGAHLTRVGLLVLAVVSLTVGVTPPSPQSNLHPGPGPGFEVATWTRPLLPVPRSLFGVTINSGTGALPSFQVGAVRLWDSGTRWSEIQPSRGRFSWAVLDRHVAHARSAGLPVLFVLGGTPRWASPDGQAGPYPDETRAAPPDRMADWDAFVTALVTRYRGQIQAYELWVLGNDSRFFAGSVETLVEMTRRASRIIRTIDPRATLVCPGMGNLWSPTGQATLRRFAELGGYSSCDVAGIKLHQRSASDPPETMLDLATTIDRTFHGLGLHPRIWSTGTTYSIPLERPLDEHIARDFAARFYLVGMYARDLNLERMYFYNWGGARIPLVLQAEGSPPTAAARAVQEVERWLAHARSRSCGHGSAINLPPNVWQCEFLLMDSGHPVSAVIRWAETGRVLVPADAGTRTLHRLDGTTIAVHSGEPIPISGEPVLLSDGG